MKLYSRPGNDLPDRFSLIVEALAGLRSRSLSMVKRSPAMNVASLPSILSGTAGMMPACSSMPSI